MRVPTLSMLPLTCSILAFAQSQSPPAARAFAQFDQLDEIRLRRCDIQVPEGFSCAVLFDVGIPDADGMIASILGEDVPQVFVYLDGRLYTIGAVCCRPALRPKLERPALQYQTYLQQ
jgi:hypothetical protein